MAYHAHSKQTLLDELENYTNEMTVLAPSAWDPSIRLEPPKALPSVKKRYFLKICWMIDIEDDLNWNSHSNFHVTEIILI